jgi:hypothetical protein
LIQTVHFGLALLLDPLAGRLLQQLLFVVAAAAVGEEGIHTGEEVVVHMAK